MQQTNYTAMAFLAMTFAVVGLTGLFATFSAPLPLERALARDATLDEAQAVAHRPGAAAALAALRSRLDESAGPVLGAPTAPGAAAPASNSAGAEPAADIDARIQAERLAMHARFLAEADATAQRLRWMLVVITVMGAVFGAVVLRISANIRP